MQARLEIEIEGEATSKEALSAVLKASAQRIAGAGDNDLLGDYEVKVINTRVVFPSGPRAKK